MSRLLVDDVTKTDRRALLNVNKMATISDIVAPTREYLRASGADELTVESGCVIAVGGAGIFKTAETKLTAANLDAGATFAVGNDYYVYIGVDLPPACVACTVDKYGLFFEVMKSPYSSD